MKLVTVARKEVEPLLRWNQPWIEKIALDTMLDSERAQSSEEKCSSAIEEENDSIDELYLRVQVLYTRDTLCTN